MDTDTTPQQVRSNFTQIFRYLQSYHQLRNPAVREIDNQLWKLWFRDLPNHPTIQIGEIRPDHSLEFETEATETSQESPHFLLKVSRAELPDPPQPPDGICEWLQEGWEESEREVEVIQVQEQKADLDSEEVILIYFNDDPERVRQFQDWVATRDEWVLKYRIAKKAKQVFERLYDLHSWMEREAEQVELVLGDGLLFWKREDHETIQHPVLLQRIRLTFDASIPEFTIVETEHSPELYTALFRSLHDVNANVLKNSIVEIDQHGWHPLADEGTSDFLKRLVTSLSPHGEFFEDTSQKELKRTPRMYRDPVLYLRKKNLGFATAIEKILEDIPSRDSLSEAVANISGMNVDREEQSHQLINVIEVAESNGLDEKVLLSKDANAEQLQIAQRLDQYNAVLVQGPPGTGKTHSIANLLGHLLAQGKSVLVTSHTTKALQVLREKVVESLQPLCVTMLDDDAESRSQLENSIDVITDRLGNSDLATLERSAKVFEEERHHLLGQLRGLRQKLKLARQDEYRPIVVAGEEHDPSKAARMVAEDADEQGWIPSPVQLGAPLPLSEEELYTLYRSNVEVTAEDESEIASELISPRQIMEPDMFDQTVEVLQRLANSNIEYRVDLWKTSEGGQNPETIERLLNRLLLAVEVLKDETEWRMTTLTAGMQGHRKPWDELLQEIERVYQIGVENQSLFLKWGPMIEESLPLEEATNVLAEILQHVQKGGKLNKLNLFLKGNWKKVLGKVKVNDKVPSTEEQVRSLLEYARLEEARQQLLNRWQRQVTVLGGPAPHELGREPEKVARHFSDLLLQCLNWYHEQWNEVVQELSHIGFQWEKFLSETPTKLVANGQIMRLRDVVIEKLPEVLQVQCDRLEKQRVDAQLSRLENALSFNSERSVADVIHRLKRAAKEMDVVVYREAYERLVELHSRNTILLVRRELLEKLEKVAPSWSFAIRARQDVHGRSEMPGDVKEAWLWRQLHDELDNRAKTSLEELQADILKIADRIREVTAQLVENKAWASQVRRTTLTQQQALQGWKTLIKKAGKRTGARAPRLLAEARKLMPICQTAVPVWIMPLSRVVENFDPGKNTFDVVIIDEASQSDMMALTALYLGKQVVVVGDDEQVSPESVGTRADDVQQIIDTHLQGIPNASLYDGISSIYDLAKTSFSMVGLKEHFRCVAPIIQFSNHLSYGGTIKPLRDASQLKRVPPTVAYRVENAVVTDGKLNVREAETISSLLIAATEQPEYKDATFGVISLIGDQQALYIDGLLRKHLPAKSYIQHKIRCGNPAQFQGDERHVMFLSTLYAPSGDGPLRRLSDPGDRFKKRFNVAASRAQDQMWVVHSLDPETDLKPDDIRRRLIMHARDPEAVTRSIEAVERHTESEFESRVARILLEKGFRVIPQWEVGAYRIDMVVEGNGKRLAVECDGDRWHPPAKLEEDMARQAILERLGWRFVRIRGSQFFRNPELAMRPVLERLASLGILPDREDAGNDVPVHRIGDELKERVIRRAAEIRREWENTKPETISMTGSSVSMKPVRHEQLTLDLLNNKQLKLDIE